MLKLVLLMTLAIAWPFAAEGGYCDYVRTKDCFHQIDHTKVCGSDGKTYWNTCALGKAHCENTSIHKVSEGACPGSIPATTTKPINGSVIAFDIFCMDVAYINCPPTGPQVCATNQMRYGNMCEFDKARCTHRDIHVDQSGASCP